MIRICSAGCACSAVDSTSIWNASGCSASAASMAGGFIEGKMCGRSAPSERVVIHRRQIVMDQRECMHHLDRGGRCIEVIGFNTKRLARGVYQQWANTFSAAEYGITHRLVQPRGR